ncbi:MAG: hypothetical protein VXZ72_05515 [Chlamydiota bacterium]|nr:hypothetical protein [Chlamydiota bacterium]
MNIKELLESKIREFDASIDLTEGSRIQRTVITPIVDSLSLDPLSVSTREYLYARFEEAFPDSPITRGNALDDILITASEYFLDGYRAELTSLKNATSLDNLDLLSDDEANALASNWFVARDEGARATGTVTIVVDRPSSINVNTSSVRFFAGEIEYAPTTNVVISTDALLANSVGSSLYEFTLSIQAVAVGSEFNAAAESISRVTGMANVVSVTNNAPVLGGIGRDTTEYLLSNKLPRAISERSLVTARGIGARISTDLPGILRYQVIGHGEVEMLRDRVDVKSFADLVASGHIYYMSSFALISSFPYNNGGGLSKGDYLQTIGTFGASDSLRIAKVIASLQVSALSNNPLGTTTLVELESPPVEGVEAATVSVLRPGSALLNTTVVDSDIGIGGRADVYIKGDTEQQIVGSSTLNLVDNSYRGSGWDMSGNVVTIELAAAIERNEFSRYQHIVLNGTAYTISSISLDPNELRAYVTVYGADVTDSGTDYFILDDLVYNTGADFTVVSPSNGGEARLSCIIGSPEASLLDIDLITDGVKQGDVIDIPTLGIRRSIFSVNTLASLSVDTVFQQTLSDVGARVIRFVSRVISPVSEVDVPTVPPQHPISVDVEAIRAEVGEVTFGEGNILLPLGEAVADAMASTDIHTIFADVYNTLDYIVLLTESESTNAPNRLSPAARGYLHESPSDLGLCNVLVAEPAESTPTGRVINGLYEMRMWCDLFTRNANNIFVLRGDTRTYSRILDFPGNEVNRGDVLRITTGYLAGDYVIESVLHNVLKREGKRPTARFSQGYVNVMEGEYTYSDITDAQLSDDIWYQKVTFVRIYGEFPKNPMSALASQLAVTLQERYTDPRTSAQSGYPRNNWTYGSISSSFINAYVNGSRDMFEPTASQQILEAFRGALSNAVLPPQTVNDTVDLTAMFEQSLTASYRIIRPSQSIGRVKTRHSGDTAVLARPSAPLIDVDNLIKDLDEGNVRTINHKYHTVLTGSEGTYHLSPKERYYIDGPDYKAWPSNVPPHIYDDRTLPPATSHDTFGTDYFLFDSLLENAAGGILPARVAGPSSVTNPYMRNDGTRLLRYPELPLINSALSLATTSVSSDSFYFTAPLFPGDEVMVSQTCHIRFVDAPADEIVTLRYIPATEAEYDDVIASLGNAVDGTGTRLSTIYREHAALFKVSHPDAAALQFLVGLYGQLVVASFLQIAPAPSFITDEFLMGSLLPSQGLNYRLPDLGCVPTSVATVSQRADRMEVIPSTELSVLETNIVGNRLRIDYRDEVYWRRISGVDGHDLYLEEPLPFGTPTCVAYGLCVVDLDQNTISLISDPIFYGGEDALLDWDEEFTTHLNTGGASRALTSADIGRHITVWGYRSNEVDYRGVLLDANLPEFDSFESYVATLLNAERETFGQFEITDVVPTFSAVSEGAESVPKRIDISIGGSFSVDAPRVIAVEATKVLCAFAVTDSVLSLEDGLINSVAKINMFAQDPFEYRFVGVSTSDPTEYLIQPLFGSDVYEYEAISDQTISQQDVSTFVLTQDHSLEPTTIETDHLVVLSENSDLVIRTTNAQSSVAAQSMHAYGERALGYTLGPVDLGTSKSVLENIEIRVPCTPGTVSETLTVSGFFDPTIGQAQSLVDSTNERPVCADLLVKTLHQAYIGLEVSYVGGPSQEEVKQALTDFIRSRVLTDAVITRSKIVSLIMNMGASTVNEPIDLYICIEDNERRIHKRTIIDGLSEATLFKTSSTLRTIYPTIAVDERLGASIVVTRLSQAINTVGNGGS